MRRFYTDPEQISKSTATITGPDAKHISQVLRLKAGEQIELFDGTGCLYLAEIVSIEKRSVMATIIKTFSKQSKPPYLFVAQSILKGKKMDLLYQKLTELSVDGLYPFTSQFCDIKAPQTKQIERWQRISLEACKQCKRSEILECPPSESFTDLLKKCVPFDCKIIFWEKESDHFLSSFTPLTGQPASTVILLGPEGGFADTEIAQAKEHGFSTVSLGPRILRAETAAIAAVSIVQHMLGNLNRIDTIDWESTK